MVAHWYSIKNDSFNIEKYYSKLRHSENLLKYIKVQYIKNTNARKRFSIVGTKL